MSVLKDQQIVNLFCDILARFKGKIDVIKEISISDDDFDRDEKSYCIAVIDKKVFLPCEEIQGKLNFEKFCEACREICGLIEKLIKTLESEKSFDPLLEFLDECALKWLNYNSILKNHRQQKQAVVNLKNCHVLVSRENEEKTDNSDELYFQRRYDFFQNRYEIKIEKKFQINWIKAQINQNDFRLDLVEQKIKTDSKNLKEKMENEQESVDKIKLFYTQKIQELQAEVKRMSAEYDKQIDEVEFRYQIAAEEKKRFQQLLDSQMKIFAQREQEMKDFIVMQNKKATDKKRREMLEVKAVKLQSWWRGEMVRKFKGPFKAYKKRVLEAEKELELEKAKAKIAAKLEKKKKK